MVMSSSRPSVGGIRVACEVAYLTVVYRQDTGTRTCLEVIIVDEADGAETTL